MLYTAFFYPPHPPHTHTNKNFFKSQISTNILEASEQFRSFL